MPFANFLNAELLNHYICSTLGFCSVCILKKKIEEDLPQFTYCITQLQIFMSFGPTVAVKSQRNNRLSEFSSRGSITSVSYSKGLQTCKKFLYRKIDIYPANKGIFVQLKRKVRRDEKICAVKDSQKTQSSDLQIFVWRFLKNLFPSTKCLSYCLSFSWEKNISISTLPQFYQFYSLFYRAILIKVPIPTLLFISCRLRRTVCMSFYLNLCCLLSKNMNW